MPFLITKSSVKHLVITDIKLVIVNENEKLDSNFRLHTFETITIKAYGHHAFSLPIFN